MPQVSVIVTTYNRAGFISKAVDTVMKQTVQDFELVLVDDCSTDNTEEVARSFEDPRIIYVKRERNGGPSAARNSGIMAAKSEYISFLDDDNEWFPKKLELQLEVFKKHPGAGVVYGGWQWLLGTTGVVEKRRIPDENGLFSGLPRWRHNVIDDLLVRRSLALETPFDETMRTYECTEFLVRLAKKARFAFVPRLIATGYHHPGERASSSGVKMAAGLRHLLSVHNDFIRAEPKAWSELNLTLGALYIRAIIWGVLGPGYLKPALGAVWEALKTKPVYWTGWYNFFTGIMPFPAQRVAARLGFPMP